MPEFDVMVGGFPCQAFSLAGYRQGFDDEKGRGTLFFEMMRIIREKKAAGHQSKVVFFENVKNLVGHDHGNTFQVIQEQLEYLGYHIKTKVLNAMEYGNVPQNRLSPKARQYFQAMTALRCWAECRGVRLRNDWHCRCSCLQALRHGESYDL